MSFSSGQTKVSFIRGCQFNQLFAEPGSISLGLYKFYEQFLLSDVQWLDTIPFPVFHCGKINSCLFPHKKFRYIIYSIAYLLEDILGLNHCKHRLCKSRGLNRSRQILYCRQTCNLCQIPYHFWTRCHPLAQSLVVHKLKRNNAYQQPSKTPSSFLFSLRWNGLTPVKRERHATKLLWRQCSDFNVTCK